MFGLVLDFYWAAPGDEAKVSVTGPTLAAIDSIGSINPLNSAGEWPRSSLSPVHAKIVTNSATGQPIAGHVCQIIG